MKQFRVAILLIFISITGLGTISCTTNEADDDGFDDELSSELETAEDAESSSETAVEDSDSPDSTADSAGDADAEKTDDESEEDEFLAEDTTAPGKTDTDSLEEQDLKGELEKENLTTAQNTPPPPVPENAPPPDQPTVGVVEQQPPPADVATAAVTGAPQDSDGYEVINPPLPQEDLGVSDPLVAEVDPPLPSVKAAQEIVPLSKMNKDPFFRNERLMNSVYIVRPNEDLAIISQKIFNEDKTSQLFADNPHLTKGIETGDKIYYNSPNRPEDKRTILTYFEDNKMSPQYYLTRKGDDIKKIGREVLGHEDGWKEIWATNDTLQTQAQLPSGLKIRYWSGSEPKAYEAPALASNTETTSAGIVGGDKEPPPPQPETLPEIPPSSEPVAMNTEDPGMAAPSAAMTSDHMPATPVANTATIQTEDNSVMTVAAIALIAMAALGIIAIQIKNRRSQGSSMPPSLEFTKV